MKTTKINIILFALLSAMAALSHSSVILASGKEPNALPLAAKVDNLITLHPDKTCYAITGILFSGLETTVIKATGHIAPINPLAGGGVFIVGTGVSGMLWLMAYDVCKKKRAERAEIARRNKKA
ncbi:MAG: hypothetical protein AAF900_00005 [Bacteroidota bacterium]